MSILQLGRNFQPSKLNTEPGLMAICRDPEKFFLSLLWTFAGGRVTRGPNSKARTAVQNKTYLYIESKQLFQV